MIHPTHSDLAALAEGAHALSNEPSVRVRLVNCRLERRPTAISRVVVELSGPGPDQTFTCQREGTACPAGDLRLASLATLDAVARAPGGAIHIELIGAKPIRAFDTNLVVVAAIARIDGRAIKILGTAIVEDDLLLATSRATLAAVNRLASPLLVGQIERS
jgi:hypothetical protein